MAFGGLLEGFLAEKNFDEPRHRRHLRMEIATRRSLTETGNEKLLMKKLSTVSAPIPKYSWTLVSRGKLRFH
ncbi:unnamed protein product [Cylicocyclus nassatus]|uniref:Uncharacterized protein n=1 Tax=Cylicocyclus nassatus TaxID=53992 RepID=A0AA36HCZ1_CYLNA|nr:unnamed protein product [Cylicocyclus nassatus]